MQIYVKNMHMLYTSVVYLTLDNIWKMNNRKNDNRNIGNTRQYTLLASSLVI